MIQNKNTGAGIKDHPVWPVPLEQKPFSQADVVTASEAYKRRFAGRTGAWFLEQQAKALLSMLEPWPGASILDVGGGHGQYTDLLISRGYNLTILGSSPEADVQVRELVLSNKCRYITGDLNNYLLPERSYDIVISFRLVNHLDHWKEFLHKLSRTARNAIIVDFAPLHSFNCTYTMFFWLKRLIEGDTTRHFYVFDERDVVETFRDSGFRPTARNAQFFLPMVLHRTLKILPVSMGIETLFRRLTLTDRFGSPLILRFEPDDAGCFGMIKPAA